ncbi:replication initiator protein [Dipodfec virus RodF1_11]|uniref:Replication initiator protein n=1 Tax=Dipodfec virus RodF1_11 TaxID=2929288 RepID=A0A976N2L1_9VIRU|nr:replication initiator protein [Dipodfec virus RodF1_11]
MCYHYHTIKNPYTGHEIETTCGRCKPCLEIKANSRQSKIYKHSILNSENLCLFFTNDYSNDYIPYIFRSDIDKLFSSNYELPIYRDSNRRFIFDRHTGKSRLKQIKNTDSHGNIKPFVVGKIEDVEEMSFIKHTSDLFKIPGIVKNKSFDSEKIPVSLSSDFSLFVKRLRRYLSYYGLPALLSYYRVSEYGPTTFRPHFHCLLWFSVTFSSTDPALLSKLKKAVCKAWPYSDLSEDDRKISIARNPAAYVSSYMSMPTECSSFYYSRTIRPKSSHSQGFAFSSKKDPSLVLELIRRGDILFHEKYINKKGELVEVDDFIPDYILRRLFPVFRGYYKLDDFSLRLFITDEHFRRKISYINGMSESEYDSITRSFNRACGLFGLSSLSEYADVYNRFRVIRRQYFSTLKYSSLAEFEPESFLKTFYEAPSIFFMMQRKFVKRDFHFFDDVYESNKKSIDEFIGKYGVDKSDYPTVSSMNERLSSQFDSKLKIRRESYYKSLIK